mgnify:CR=1 FL=1
MSNVWLCVADGFIILVLLFGLICIGYNILGSHGWERFFSVMGFIYANAFILYLVLKDFMGVL